MLFQRSCRFAAPVLRAVVLAVAAVAVVAIAAVVIVVVAGTAGALGGWIDGPGSARAALIPPASSSGLPGAASSPAGPSPVVATFSIVACDTTSGIWGVAVASKFLAVGAVVPWARGDVGAVATQAQANTSFGPRGLDLLARGLEPDEVLNVLLRPDTLRDRRQVGIVGAHGRAATYTGSKCNPWAGGKSGRCFAAQGNILTGPEVVDAMAKSFESSSGFLGDRMLAALEAGDAAGGDSRGRQSAAIYLAATGQGWGNNDDRFCDLRVDDHADPIRELRRVYNVWRPNQAITEGYRLLDQGRFAEAIARGEEALRLEPDSAQPYYHLACFQSRAGNPDEAVRLIGEALHRDPKLRDSAATDPDLAPLREREDFRKLIGQKQEQK